ncbi:N-acetyl-gamma-glutamyl-phosphate reductase [Thalassotalea maritima]|uniref:N-acetyl-gamma-glutamyl-phosphate reductase n=1 Tax=Thalassotalea maritima TaxID=3242416 RepID=UPI003526FDA7
MKIAVIGASGYAGAELVKILINHPQVDDLALLVSEHSESQNQPFSQLYPQMHGICDIPLQAFNIAWLNANQSEIDAVFFATPHEYSAQWAQPFIDADIKVFDLSGAFRLKDVDDYPQHYDFTHQYPQLLAEAVYGLAEFNAQAIAASNIIAVPGCYPTASLLAIKPMADADLLDDNSITVINGISGVSGAGRKASLATSFNELSLKAYNVLQHRHQPEISQQAGCSVIFNPHIAPFKRGLLATVTMRLKQGITTDDINALYQQYYQHQPLVRLMPSWPQVDDVANTPFANLHWQYDAKLQVLVASCAIDNLLKGAAAQAVQCFNIRYGFAPTQALVGGNHG